MSYINYIMKPQSDNNKNSGARLQIKKLNKQTKEIKPEQKALKPIIEEKSKQKDKKDKKDKNDEKIQQKQGKDKKDKKKDKKGKEEQKVEEKLSKSKEKKSKTDKQSKKDKNGKDKKDKKNKNGKEQSSPQKKGSQSKSLLRKRSDKELDTINSIHKTQNKAKMTIEELIEQYKSQAQRLLFHNKGYDPDKQRQIQKMLESHQKDKQKRHKKLGQLEDHQQQIHKSRQKSKQVKLELRKERIRQRKIKRVEQKLSSIELNAEQRKRDYQKFIEYVLQRKKFKPRFKKYEQEYQQYIKEEADDYRDKLDELTRKYEPMNQNDLLNFEENYIAQLNQSIHYRENKLKLEQDLIKQQNERREKLLWKGQCHKNISDEQTKRLQKKKQPWEKLQAIKEYGKFVNENFKKKRQEIGGEEDENAEIIQEVAQNERIAYHQRYVKGVNYGLVPYDKPSPLTQEQKFKKGNDYLEQIKLENKNRKNKTVDHSQLDTSRKLSVSQDLKKKDEKTFRLRKKSNPYYPTDGNKKHIDFKNYQAIEFSLEKINSLRKDRELNDQIVKHGEYRSILDIQERKRRGGSLVIKQINQKLNILKKL